MLRRDLIALACTGCSQVFDISPTILVDAAPLYLDAAPPAPPDRDRDGIVDADDPCISSIADPLADYEGDSYPNGTDACPFDYELDNTDSDGDGVFAVCDPFPSLAGERRRCIMAFQNPTITRELLVPRTEDTATWDLLSPTNITGIGTGTILAAERIEAPAPLVTTYQTLFYASPATTGGTAGAILWLRAGASAQPSDVGCQVRGTSSAATLTLLGAPSPTSAALPAGITSWKVTATFAPSVGGRSNVRCAALPGFGDGTPVVVAAEIALPDGAAGFGVDGTVSSGGLWILERDDLPPL